MKLFTAVIFKLSRYLTYIGGAAVIIVMLMTVYDITMRYLFNLPLLGSIEIAQYLLSVMVFASMAWVESLEDHISIPLVTDRLSPMIRKVIITIMYILGFGILVLISMNSFELAGEYMRREEASAVLRIPASPFIYFVAIGSSLFALVTLLNLIKYAVGKQQ